MKIFKVLIVFLYCLIFFWNCLTTSSSSKYKSPSGFFTSDAATQDAFMKGITFGAMYWPEKNLSLVDYNLKKLKSIGVNSVILVIDWYVDDYSDPTIEPWYRDKPDFPDTDWYFPTLYDNEVIEIITKAHNMGFNVLLKPHVDPLDWAFGGIGRWGLQIDTGNWDTLFDSYLNYISHYAKIAEFLNVKILIIGCELDSMTHTSVSGLSNPDERWRHIINEIRKIYNGKLTYSCAFTGSATRTWSAPNKITFWDALDYIGFEIYRGLTKDNPNPSLDELKNGVKDIFNNYIKPLSIQYDKDVLIPEINYYSFDGVNTNPLSEPNFSPFNYDNSKVDIHEQADCYYAVLSVIDEINMEEDYLKGIFWWAGYLIDPNLNYDWTLKYKGDYFWFKPAEDVLKIFWAN